MARILFLTKFFAPHVGGVEEHVAQLSQELYHRGHTITLVTNQFDLSLPLFERAKKWQVYRIPQVALDRKFPTWGWIIRHWPLFWQADVIHAHDVLWWALPLRLLFFWKTYGITFHGYEGINPPDDSQIKAHRLWNRLATASLSIGAFHDKWYHLRSTVVSFGAVELLPAKKKTRSTQTKIAYIGRLAEDVGILTYLQAVKQLKKKHKLQVDVYGDGPQRAEAEAFVQKHSLPVTFFGFVPNAERKLSHYDLAFVSRYLAILSALQQEVRVIAQANNAIKYDYLALSPFVDGIQIGRNAAEITGAFENPLPSSPQKAAQAWAQKQTWAAMADTYQALWHLSVE